MAEPAPRRPVRRRRWWRRSALPRSRTALALGALVAAILVLLLFLGLTRAEPGLDVPSYEPPATTTTTTVPVIPPVITTRTTIAAAAPPAAGAPTTRPR